MSARAPLPRAPEVVRQRDPHDGRVWLLFVERPTVDWIARLKAAGWKSAIQHKGWYHPKGAAPPIGLAITDGAAAHVPSLREAELALIPMTGVLPAPPPAPTRAPTSDPRPGDLVVLQRQAFLVATATDTFVSGYYVGGGNDGYRGTKIRITHLAAILRRATPALLAALEHRQNRRTRSGGDQRWRDLMAAAMSEQNEEGTRP